MNLGISGKRALVVASSQGIGFAAAKVLAQEGARVVICSRSRERLDEAEREIFEDTGVRVGSYVVDLGVAGDISELANQIRRDYGGVDILVTNSGGPPALSFFEAEDEHWHQTVDTLLMSTVRLIREFLPQMVEQGWGRVIAVTSISCTQPHPDLLLSNSVRTSIHGLLKTLVSSHSKHGITFNAVLPGYTLTQRTQELATARASRTGRSFQEVMEEMGKRAPVGRCGDPMETASMIAYLASVQAGFVNGTSILVDGGESRGMF